MTKTIAWVEDPTEKIYTEAYRMDLSTKFPELEFKHYNTAMEAYEDAKKKDQPDLWVIDDLVMPGRGYPNFKELQQQGESVLKIARIGFIYIDPRLDPRGVGLDLASIIRMTNKDVPIILYGKNNETSNINLPEYLKRKIAISNPATEVINLNAVSALPFELTERVERYLK